MTTESKQLSRPRGGSVLLGAAAVTLLLGLLGAGAAALWWGSEAALGTLVGTLMVVAIFALGSLTVNAVAGRLPAASLLFALLTYALQLMLMALAFAMLEESGLLDGTLDRRWVGGAVIGGTLIWVVAQIMLTTRRRIPIYDLTPSEPAPAAPEAGHRGSDRGAR